MGLIEKLYLNLLSYSSPGWAAAIGGILVVITLFLSMFLLFQHLSSYRNPEVLHTLFLNWFSDFASNSFSATLFFVQQEQKFLVGVILMVPCYSVESVSSLFTKIIQFGNLNPSSPCCLVNKLPIGETPVFPVTVKKKMFCVSEQEVYMSTQVFDCKVNLDITVSSFADKCLYLR